MAKSGSNTVLLGSILIYALVVLTIKQSLAIIFIGTVTGLIARESQDQIYLMFSGIARFITQLKPKPSSAIRSQIIKMCASIDGYPGYMDSILSRKKRLYFMLTPSQQNASIATYKRIKNVEDRSSKNYEFLQRIRDYAMREFHISKAEVMACSTAAPYSCIDMIEHLVRDWQYNEEVRNVLFEPILKRLKKGRILVPGSGFGRLGVEIAKRNQDSEVDCIEFSAEMWFGSKYAVSGPPNGVIYPYLQYFSHWRKGKDQLEPVDLKFSANVPNVNFCYRNFLEISETTKYDSIATLFFIDTAQNVFEYIDKILSLLKRGGVWCNYGPLKWGTAAYAELSMDELLDYLNSHGWKVNETWEGTNRYNGSESSMLNTRYQVIGWVATKK